MAHKIIVSLEKDIPVIFLTNLNSDVYCYGVNTENSNKLGTHYVTVTGICKDTITSEITLTVSTWSYMATISLNALYNEEKVGSEIIVLE